MIHYSATSPSGNAVRYAFLGSMRVDRDVERALTRGADMANRLFHTTAGGHNIHDGEGCRCEIHWSERPDTVWERRGFRWYVKKEERR